MRTDLSHVGGGDKQEVYIDRKGRSRSPLITSKARQCQGFTLPEVLIVIGLVGVILGLAIPGYKNYSTKANMESSVDKLTRVISFARNRALTTYPNTSIVICPSTNNADDNPTCDGDTSTDYSVGWITFIDCNGNRTYQGAVDVCDTNGDSVAETPEILLQRQPTFNDLSIASGINGTDTRVEFHRTGQAAASSTFEITKDGRTFAKITMNAIGRVDVAPNTTFYDY